MSSNFKYDKKTLMELLKIVLATHDDITPQEKQDILKIMQLLLNQSDEKHEDKQNIFNTDYKRRN